MPQTKQTIGQRLKSIRISRQISLDKVAQATHVRVHYLQALEEDDYSVMSSAAQGRGFLRLYADFLGLDLEAATEELRREETAEKPSEPPAPASAAPSPEPEPAPQAPPASPPEGTATRRPFWARLLRRDLPEETTGTESAPEPVQEPPSEPVIASEREPETAPGLPAEPVIIPETESESERGLAPESVPAPAEKPAKKTTPRKAASKSKAPAQKGRPKGKPAKAAETPAGIQTESSAQAADKKKVLVNKT